jgi:glycosyltransferase involved in cell wall biosynthesis
MVRLHPPLKVDQAEAPRAMRRRRPLWLEDDTDEIPSGPRERGRLAEDSGLAAVRPGRVDEALEAALAQSPASIRLGVVCDYLDEGWPSMDLAAELLAEALAAFAPREFRATLLRPPMPRLARRASGSGLARNADRWFGRYVAYPRWLRRRAGSFDLFHVVDHSYAHLAHVLPSTRTVVTCHDLDAFRSLVSPADEPRPPWFRQTMKRVLSGMRKAAVVVCDSHVVRAEIERHDLVAPERLVVVPLPVHPDFAPDPDPLADREAARLLGPVDAASVELLHVGINVPRKRIEFLLELFAEVRRKHPAARLVRVGGVLSDAQRTRARELGIAGAVVEMPYLERPVLAAVYRRAAAVLLPSLREGFGLPLVEAMACGTPVVASDLDVFREVGGEAAEYLRPGDTAGWAAAVDALLWDRRDAGQRRGRRKAVLERADAFSLEAYARGMVDVYHRVLWTGRR